MEEEQSTELGPPRSTLRATLCSPTVIVFVVVIFISGLSSGVIDAFLFLRLKGLGASGPLLGAARFIMCAAEVPVFRVAGRLYKRLGTFWLLSLCQAAYVVRFVSYSLITNPVHVLPVELLHGCTFALTWSTALIFAEAISPPDSTAFVISIIEGAHWGVGTGLGALIGGFVYQSRGPVFLFSVCACLSVATFIIAVVAAVCFKTLHAPAPPPTAAAGVELVSVKDEDVAPS